MMTSLSPAPARRSVRRFVRPAGVTRPANENPAAVRAGRGFQELRYKQGVFAMPKSKRADARAQEPERGFWLENIATPGPEEWHHVLGRGLAIEARITLERYARHAALMIDQFCESPIEKMFAAAMQRLDPTPGQPHDLHFTPAGFENLDASLERDAAGWEKWEDGGPCSGDWTGLLIPQCQIGAYRVDFLAAAVFCGGIAPRPKMKLVIECDGHDFHDRTKEQAAYDRERDRTLLAMGIPVVRFTGSQIYRAPSDCAIEVLNFFRQWSAPLERAYNEELEARWRKGGNNG